MPSPVTKVTLLEGEVVKILNEPVILNIYEYEDGIRTSDTPTEMIELVAEGLVYLTLSTGKTKKLLSKHVTLFVEDQAAAGDPDGPVYHHWAEYKDSSGALYRHDLAVGCTLQRIPRFIDNV